MIENENAQRAAVVAGARSWIGTPYHNCADIKGVGVDCGMLLVRVFVDAGLCAPFDPRPYPADWHLHRGEERYLGFFADRCGEVAVPSPGDIMMLRYGRCYAHGGIVTRAEPVTIVHAFHPARRVVEEEIDHNIRARFHRQVEARRCGFRLAREMNVKPGKRPARPGAARLKLASYTNIAALPPLPACFGHDSSIGAADWGILANDRYGDCVWAGAAHETMLLAREAGRAVTFTDADVLGDYAAVTGFDPARPDTDQGTDVVEAADYRRSTGVIDALGVRHKIAAYLALEPGNVQHLYQATYLFGVAGVGLQLPSSAIEQSKQRESWRVITGAAIEGGHYVPLVGRQADGLHVVSWGALQVMTEAFLQQYCDEAIAYVSEECLVGRKNPEGFAYDDLIADLAALA